MTVTLEVYEANATTYVDDIDPGQFRYAEFTDQLSAPGKGEVRLPRYIDAANTLNPAIALCTYGRVIRFVVDGESRFQMMIEEKDNVVVASVEEGEEAGEVLTVSGRGCMARFDYIRIIPDVGLRRSPYHTTRFFNYSADRLRDNDAAAPQGIWPFGYGQLPNYDTNNYFGRPEGFIDTAGPDSLGPEWIWATDTRISYSLPGDCYGRQRFTPPGTPGDIIDTLWGFACDDAGEFWVDGRAVAKIEGIYKGEAAIVGMRMTAGVEHLLAWKATNHNALRAGAAYYGATVSDGMVDTIFVRSDASACRVLAYPDNPPGFTPTEVIRLVVDERQDQGRLTDMTLNFLSATDTDGVQMTEVSDIAVKSPSDSILTLLMMLGETYLDLDMQPEGLILDAWIRGTKGGLPQEQLEAGFGMAPGGLAAYGGLGDDYVPDGTLIDVTIPAGAFKRVAHEGSVAEKATVAMVSGDHFPPFSVSHPDVLTLGYYEVALSFGEASKATAQRLAEDYIAQVANARKGLEVALVPGFGITPYVHFTKGDSIPIPGDVAGTTTVHRVVSIGMVLDGDEPEWSIELDQPRKLLEERLGAIMRRQQPGAVGGRTILPEITKPQFMPTQTGRESSHSWQWDLV